MSKQEPVAVSLDDVLTDRHWNLSQMLAWIYYRSPAEVAMSGSGRPFCVMREYIRSDGKPPKYYAGADAKKELVNVFIDGVLTASAYKNGEGNRADVPAEYWNDTTIDSDPDSDRTTLIDPVRGSATWADPKIKSEHIVTVYPPADALIRWVSDNAFDTWRVLDGACVLVGCPPREAYFKTDAAGRERLIRDASARKKMESMYRRIKDAIDPKKTLAVIANRDPKNRWMNLRLNPLELLNWARTEGIGVPDEIYNAVNSESKTEKPSDSDADALANVQNLETHPDQGNGTKQNDYVPRTALTRLLFKTLKLEYSDRKGKFPTWRELIESLESADTEGDVINNVDSRKEFIGWYDSDGNMQKTLFADIPDLLTPMRNTIKENSG